ncbi:MAG: serine/threonine protein kinase [Candidatus Melainabacteria bacterium]|nr:serine/threonine protein kinase [Candidatus Melainabacteria bacterium]
MNDQSRSRLFTLQQETLVAACEEDQVPGRYLETGSIIDGKFRVLNLLGEGGMGAVYRVRHLMLQKDVALKTFSRSSLTEETCLRFQREAQALGKLNHGNIIAVYDFGLSQEGIPYYTMEFLSGCSLADRIKSDGPIAAVEAVQVFQQVCRGLSLAHSKGIIHRDLKPGNIFLTAGGGSAEADDVCAKIVDFGIASLTDTSGQGQRLTRCGAVFGSPLYMSPEQAAGLPVTARSDIYSLGCTIFEALTGVPPYQGCSAVETVVMHSSAPLPGLQEAAGGKYFPAELEQLVVRMLEKAPQARPADMKEVELALRKLSLGDTLRVSADSRECDQPANSTRALGLKPGRICILSAVCLIGLCFAAALGTGVWGGNSSPRAVPSEKFVEKNDYDTINPNLPALKNQATGLDACLSRDELTAFRAAVVSGQYEKGIGLLRKNMERRHYALDSPEQAELLSNIGVCYSSLNQYGQAEEKLGEAISIFERQYGSDSERLATSLMFLAVCKTKQDQFAEAEQLFRKALSIAERRLGKDDLFVADCLTGYGQMYFARGDRTHAESCLSRASLIYEQNELEEGDLRLRAKAIARSLLDRIQRR